MHFTDMFGASLNDIGREAEAFFSCGRRANGGAL
jgi:hypothetical protein